MNGEREKYANGDSLESSKMTKEERNRAIEYWCEGNQELKKLLLYFSENDIETIGCCSGHDKDDEHFKSESAYIAIKLKKESDDTVIDLLALLEENKLEMTIGFVRSAVEKYSCILYNQEFGKSEKYFETINKMLSVLDRGYKVPEKLRKKYEMLRTMLIDDRAKKESRGTQYCFDLGDENIKATGFFKYSGKIVSIPNYEIERMGECLYNNREEEIPEDFYSEEIKEEKCSINYLKEVARISKQPLNLIKNAFETIKNVIKKTTKEQGECAR